MPRRDDLQKILLIGSGPIVIGQAAEFDYSGVQACKVLREEGYEVVLVNSNPATIMTDPEFADRTYVEPLTLESVRAIVERERPDALLPTLGGQTALNLAMELRDDGVLDRLGVEMIGANHEAIRRAEDREEFRKTMEDAGLRVPWSVIVTSVAEVESGVADGSIELPAIVRPAFTLGGQGGGVGTTSTELLQVVSEGLAASPINQVLVEESVIGWGEFELELMRDRNDNVVVICSIENVDPMGVHTGDSVTIAPAQTLTDQLYQELRNQAIKVIRAVGVETGGSNIQFAVNPASGEIVVIEMNPRVSRSSALASKATGFPIAKIAAKLAVGYALEEIPNDITKATPGLVRADHRLRRHQDPALRLREVPGRPGRADDPHEVGGGGDGDRPDLPRVVRQGDALARARLARGDPGRHRGAPDAARDALVGSLRPGPRGLSPGCLDRGARGPYLDRPLVPARAPRPRASKATAPRASSAATGRSIPAPPSSRPRRPTTTPRTSGRNRRRFAGGTGLRS